MALSKNPDVPAIKEYFGDEQCYKDYSSAGYLLANAFRRSSSTAPDKLPSVQVSAALSNKCRTSDSNTRIVANPPNILKEMESLREGGRGNREEAKVGEFCGCSCGP